MNNYIKIVKGHYTVAKEHCKNFGINHKPTMFEAVRTTLYNILHYNYIQEGNSYLVYEVINKYTLGITIAKVISIYVPINDRGLGIASKMLDRVPYDTVLVSGYEDDKYDIVGTVRIARKSLQ